MIANPIRPARKIRETGGPTILPIGAVADGEFLKRSGSDIIGASAGGGGGLWTLQQASIVVGADTPSVTISGLDGNTDGIYLIVIDGLSASDASTPTIQPNGSTSGLTQGLHYFHKGAPPTDVGVQTLWYLYQHGDPVYFLSMITLHAKTGHPRTVYMRSTCYQGGGTDRAVTWEGNGEWTDTSANITSIVLTTNSSGNGILAGTVISVYKIDR